ncbi:MAG: nucleotidyltransferase family protein, partial [Terriglobales bacterium]
MNRTLARDVVAALGTSGGSVAARERCGRYTARAWRRNRFWLDLSGLTLYLHSRLRADAAAPTCERRHWQECARQNHHRMQLMRQEFAATNRLFRRHDIPFAVLKGFSLFPLFCPDLGMRVTYDFDYLIPASARESARRVLLQAGYRLRREDSGHGETYWCPGAGAPPPGGARLFAPGMPRSVEVHTQLWNPTEDGVGIPALRDAFERRRRVVWNDLEFEVLAPGDALIFQTLHIFRHILHNWCRLA